MSDRINRILKSIHLEAKRGSFIEGELAINWSHIKENCLKIAEELLIQTHQNKIPILLDQIAELRKIHEIQYYDTAAKYNPRFDLQGEIIPDDKGFIVYLNPDHSVARKRATLAHEIGHTLFYDTSKSPPRKVYANNDSKEEWMCWDFARSLLVPEWSISGFINQYKETPDLRSICETAKKFDVSIEILLKRIRWDFNSWGNSTMFVGSFKNREFVVNTIHKGHSDNKFTIKGKYSLLNNNKIRTFINFLYIQRKVYSIEKKVFINNNHFQINLLRFNNNPTSILGNIKKLR
jgi:Zn-dependent peptidase ImmA (M78 family)